MTEEGTTTSTPTTTTPGGSSSDGSGASGGSSGTGAKQYTVTKGDIKYTGSEAVVFEIDAELAKLAGVRLGGRQLERGAEYTAESGSVIITLMPSMLQSLENGTYSIEFVFTDGAGFTTLIVQLNSTSSGSSGGGAAGGGSVATGDGENMLLYAVLAASSMLALGFGVLTRKKKNAQ